MRGDAFVPSSKNADCVDHGCPPVIATLRNGHDFEISRQRVSTCAANSGKVLEREEMKFVT